MRDRVIWLRVFGDALVGSAVCVKTKADADELVQRAKMLADKAATVAARERFDGDELPMEEEPFPLVRPSRPPAAPGSFLFDGPGIDRGEEAYP
jgi:hypothetical protein